MEILLILIVCEFCFIVGMMAGYVLGLPKHPEPKTKASQAQDKKLFEREHFEPGGMYLG